MAYCNVADLKNRYTEKRIAELSDDQDGSDVDETIVTEIIADADALIDDALRGRYTLPLTTTPQSIKWMSCVIAYFMLWCRRENDIPETVTKKYEQAVAMLDKMATGTLTIDAAYATAKGTLYRVNKTLTNNQEFDLDTLDGFFINNENNYANS